MDGLLIAARAVHFAATISLCGLFAFECLVAGPAFRRHPVNSAAAARLNRRLDRLAWASLLLALLSGAVWLVVEAVRMSGQPLGEMLARGGLLVVSTRTRFGQVWLLRLALAALLAFSLFARRRRREQVSGAIAWAALGLGALLLATLAWAGHGGATPGKPGDLHLAADIFHLLAAGLWLGALVPLALALSELRRIGDETWAAVAQAITSRFSILAAASVGTLLAAGMVNTWFLVGSVPALIGTGYGRLLLAKVGLFLVMVVIAAVNLLRLDPRLADPSAMPRDAAGAVERNAIIEAACGLAILAIVGVIGILPPGSHTEPGWPLPFRLNWDALSPPSEICLALLAALGFGCAVAAVVTAAAGRWRRITAPLAGLLLCGVFGAMLLRPIIERAYPTSYYAPAEPYAAPSIARGMPLYAENCALCHGAGGRGDGPAAASLPTRPADLTEPHLFAHDEGDLFWWVSHGNANGVMPGFADLISADGRWDILNFVRARAAGVLTRAMGPEVTPAASFPVPDFAFEENGVQQTLRDLLKSGPVLLVLYTPPAPRARLAQLAAARSRFSAAGLGVLAVNVAPPSAEPRERAPPSAPAIAVSAGVASTLALFGTADGRGETELLLDRAANVRARWPGNGRDELADADTLVADADRVARLAVAPQGHAGHAH